MRILGSFSPPQSPPVIRLIEKNLESFFLDAMEDVFGSNWHTKGLQIKVYANIIVDKTFYHELFHFYSWYIRSHITKQPLSLMMEEPLAVALARHKINHHYYTKNKKMTMPASDAKFIDRIFNYSRQSCYGDWVKFSKLDDFNDSAHDYFGLKNNMQTYQDWHLVKCPQDVFRHIVKQDAAYFVKII